MGANSLNICPACGKGKTINYKPKLSLTRCRRCGLLFRVPAEEDKGLSRAYKAAWSDAACNIDQTGGTDLELARIYSRRLKDSLGIKNFSGLKILDFGAGKGEMLIALEELGAETYGFDPFGYDFLKERGLRVVRDLDDLQEGLRFDGIVSIDVLEHLQAPRFFIRRLSEKLAPSGWLYLSTLNLESLNARIFGYNWREFRNLTHLCFFGPKSLEAVFRGFDSLEYQRLRWLVNYSKNPLMNIAHNFLQLFSLDGELRYILRKRQV